MSLMTLDEAIQHCHDKENCSKCGQEHKQLREWLEELKELKQRNSITTPHGRLIDADKLLHVFSPEILSKEEILTMAAEPAMLMITLKITDYIKQVIKEAPTIIEAEE